MSRRVRVGRSHGWRNVFAACTVALLTAPLLLAQQSDSSSSQSASQNKSQSQPVPAPAHKGTADENPFPADVSKQAAQQQQQQGDPSAAAAAPDAPDASQAAPPPDKKPGGAAQDNPFPEDVSKGAADAAAKAADSGSSSSASPYSSSSSSNPDGAAGADPNGDIPPETGRRKLRKPSDKDIQGGSLTAQGKAQDDVKIGRYYLSTGNYKGAYDRFAEATRFDPTNVDAIYGIAAAAQGLHHADEALTNYKLYLAISPDGEHAKSAEKALRVLAK